MHVHNNAESRFFSVAHRAFFAPNPTFGLDFREHANCDSLRPNGIMRRLVQRTFQPKVSCSAHVWRVASRSAHRRCSTTNQTLEITNPHSETCSRRLDGTR